MKGQALASKYAEGKILAAATKLENKASLEKTEAQKAIAMAKADSKKASAKATAAAQKVSSKAMPHVKKGKRSLKRLGHRSISMKGALKRANRKTKTEIGLYQDSGNDSLIPAVAFAEKP